MGRLKLPEGEKKKLVTVLIPQKIINELNSVKCREIAEKAILKEYKKTNKSNPT